MSESKAEGAARAKLFWNGRSQAVRLPKDFRFEGDEVSIRREGDAVVLEPIRKPDWRPGFWQWVDEHKHELDLEEIPRLDIHLQDPGAEP